MRCLLLIVIACLVGCHGGDDLAQNQHGRSEYVDGKLHYSPDAGFVPDSVTAISVAETLLLPIVGANYTRDQHPLSAVLRDSVWVVTGSLPDGAIGGAVVLEIAKSNAAVLRFAVE